MPVNTKTLASGLCLSTKDVIVNGSVNKFDESFFSRMLSLSSKYCEDSV